eukprot:Blabericola_migrator_1__2946@NODE_184_length_11839_cov_88_277438_g159_i0_p10_GENE_NODE_184_length_11839_cov_88_277438_g159_i0NODE_184_length_11839_cov_88_277438_g159_i0_p10_ORF_typecomplete_len128_score20_61MotA_ExbB/PF01618_16/0_012Sporozoite_P67/PF05642_11/0_013Nucleoside_tran/PF01733_18/0_026SLATT_4/PF18186_1/0_045_NODE_184_length_11839_cov_88_277438_g159_i051645547
MVKDNMERLFRPPRNPDPSFSHVAQQGAGVIGVATALQAVNSGAAGARASGGSVGTIVRDALVGGFLGSVFSMVAITVYYWLKKSDSESRNERKKVILGTKLDPRYEKLHVGKESSDWSDSSSESSY